MLMSFIPGFKILRISFFLQQEVEEDLRKNNNEFTKTVKHKALDNFKKRRLWSTCVCEI